MQDNDGANTAELARKARQDPEAFGRLYDCYVQPVYRYLFHRVGNRFDAEDLTSKTFVSALEGIANYREQGHFAAWLFQIARHKLVDYYRRKQAGVPLEKVENTITSGEDKLGRVIHQDELDGLLTLIQRLDAEEQDLIYLRYVFRLTYVEMGKILGKNADAVKKSVYRLVERLKYQLE